MGTKELVEALKNLGELNVNPTVIYNEGWMVRLLVKQSIEDKITLCGVNFGALKNWSSEALIDSPFLRSTNKETYTHADVILGDFNVNFGESGQIEVNTDAKILGIIEAKMNSPLSKGTSNAEGYNQASRNVCCLAHQVYKNPKCELFFMVVAPESKRSKHESMIKKERLLQEINDRYESLKSIPSPEVMDKKDKVMDKVRDCEVRVVSYEDWIEKLKDADAKNAIIEEFYKKAIEHNKPKKHNKLWNTQPTSVTT